MNKQHVHANSDEDQLDPTLSQDASFFKSVHKSKKIQHQSICGLFFHWLFQTVQNSERRINNEGSVYPRNCISNKINNQKYSFFTFIPKFLFNEYKYFQNLYFLLLALSQFYPPFQIGFLITYVGPIVVILFLSFMKELLDEIKRMQKDKKYNNQKYIKVQFNNQTYVKSQNISVGDLLIIKKDQRVPADLILLKTTDENGSVYVRTDQLDGETDWKTRDAIKFTQDLQTYQDIYSYQWSIEIEAPNDQIYQFAGSFQGSSSDELESLRLNNTIWANMRVASGEILGVVIYTGKETRIAQNSRKPISKRGKTDKEINKLSKLLLITLAVIAVFLTIVSGRIFQEGWSLYLFRAFILLSAIIPVSMKVNLDFAKLQYSYWINKDEDIKGTVTRNSNIPEELGRIEILLSDKTGTLTKNEMIFKQLKTPYETIQSENMNSFLQTIHNIDAKIAKKENLTEKEISQMHLLKCLCLCHNVWPVGQDDDRTLQASSPDEIALVNFVESIGLHLYDRKTHEIVLKNHNDDLESFEILYNFPFSSERKRMGILLKDNQTNKYFFYLKGADIVIRKKVSTEDRLFVDEESYNLSVEGLRTLVLCYREISNEEFQNFDTQMKQAGQNLQKRDLLERKAINTLEKDMILLGISGVEDLLQDDLKSSIVTLREAGIKVWMLTGDKMETAKCIAISTGFKSHQQQFLDLNCNNLKDVEKTIENFNPSLHTLVVTGNTLELIFQDYFVVQQFFKKCIESQNVVLCRCAPKQKALVAHYLKNVYYKIVCCIGDGGNDVAMIQTGNIGIGIEGKEGMQAALSSDFSVVKFSNILKLFLWHGRLSYIRTCTLSNFVIQRGLIIAFIQVFFIITFYYVSINIYNGYLTFCYSTIFTNFPVFALIWDQDIPLSQILNYPALYYMVQKGKNLNSKVFLFLIWKSFYQASIIFLLTIILFDNSFTKIVTITFSVLIIIQYLNICNSINTWHRIIVLSIVLSLLTYLICFLFLKDLFLISKVSFQGFLYICIIALCAWGPFFVFKYMEKVFAPTQIDKVIREAKMLKKRQKEGIINYQLEIEEDNETQNGEIQNLNFIKCYNTFFPKTLTKISLLENYMIFQKKTKIFKSKMPLQLCYCIKKKQTDKSVSFNIFNFEIKHQMEINIKVKDEDSFRFIFKDYFIFTDFDRKMQINSFIDEGFYVQNQKVILMQNQKQKLKRDKFFAKIYKKQEIQKEQLIKDLEYTLMQYKRLHDCNNFLSPFGFYENQDNFIVVFNLSLAISFDKFLDINTCIKNDGILINLMISLTQVFIDLENKQVQIPVLDPNKIFVTLHTFNKILISHQKRIYMNIKRFMKNQVQHKDKKQVRYSNALYLSSQDDFSQQLNIIDNIKDLQLTNNTDITNFLLIITNTEFIFKQETHKNEIKIGYKKVKLLSNLFLNLSDNLNCINLGILLYYILSRQNLSISHEFIKPTNHQENVHYLNFPTKIINSFTLIQQQMLYYFFTLNNLQEIQQKLRNFINLEAKIHEMDQRNKSICISTSQEQNSQSKPTELSSECSEDFNINETKSISQKKSAKNLKNTCKSFTNLTHKSSQKNVSQQFLLVPNQNDQKPISTIGSPEDQKDIDKCESIHESNSSLHQINQTLQLVNDQITSSLNFEESKENIVLIDSDENLDKSENLLQEFFKKKNQFQPRFMQHMNNQFYYTMQSNQSISSDESDDNIYQTVEEISGITTPHAQSDLSDVSNFILATQKIQQETLNDIKENQAPKTHVKRTEKIEDFFRNFLLKNELVKTLDIFQIEWYELSQKKNNNDQGTQNLPDIFLENQKLEDDLKALRKELDDARIFANKTKLTWEKLRKQRDFHKLHHQRVQQEKDKLIKQITKLKDFHLHYEQKYQELCSKYEIAMKEKMLLKLERDRLTTKNNSLQDSINILQQKVSTNIENCKNENLENSKLSKSRQECKNESQQQHSKIPKPLINPYEMEKIQPVIQKQLNPTKTFKGHMQTISRLKIHQKKPFLATASDDMTWKIWSLPKGELIMSGEGHNDWISDISFHPKGTHLATASGDSTIKIWDFLNITCAWTIKDHSQPVWSIDFNHSGDFLIAGGMDHQCKLYDVTYQKSRYSFRGHVDSVNVVQFSKYNNNFYSASTDKTLSMWDIKSGLLVTTFYGHLASLNGICLSESEREIISCDAEGVVKLWDLKMMKLRGEINCGPHAANNICLDPSGEVGIVASDDCSLYVLDLNKFMVESVVKGHDDAVQDVAFDPFNKQVVSCSSDLTFRTWS